MNHGFPGNSPCSVRKVRFFPAPPEILKRPSVTPASGALVVAALDPRSRSGRRPARWPGAGAADIGERGQQLAAGAGGGLARCWRCRWRRTRPAVRGRRRRRVGRVLALQVAADAASSSWPAPAAGWPGGGAAGGGGRGQQRAAAGGAFACM